MNNLTNAQKALIRELADNCVSYHGLTKGLVIDSILGITGIYAVVWNVVEYKTTLYFDQDINRIMYFIECISIIKQLDEMGLILILAAKNDDAVNDRCVVSKKIGVNDDFKNNVECKYVYGKRGEVIPIIGTNKNYTNLCHLLEKYANSVIYPCSNLIEFVDNGYKTTELVQFEKQMNEAKKEHIQAMKTANRTLGWTRWASVIALVTFLISGIVSFTELFSIRDMTIRDLNKTIAEKHIPDVVSVKITNDTIKTIIASPEIENQAINKQDILKKGTQ